jgi:hypothetical protein
MGRLRETVLTIVRITIGDPKLFGTDDLSERDGNSPSNSVASIDNVESGYDGVATLTVAP